MRPDVRKRAAMVAAAEDVLRDPVIRRMNGSLHPGTATWEVCSIARDALAKRGLAVNMGSQRALITLTAALRDTKDEFHLVRR